MTRIRVGVRVYHPLRKAMVDTKPEYADNTVYPFIKAKPV